MARKKKLHYYVLLCGDNVYMFTTIAAAQVEGYFVLKDITGDCKLAREIMNRIDDKFESPPYPPKHTSALDVGELNKIINDIALGA